ncbi:hypothetical protein CTI14_05450 [Methylobacterium radiotolerans]|nr:hypothetical protein CTI14_05450 [Methylobacterium radiotolerans]
MVVIDTSPLDAFALDSYSLDWVSVQLTVAYDLHTRSLIAWRFTPRSTKGVDVVMLLYDLLRPKVMRRGWPDSARWPYVGVPESVVLELVEDTKDPDADRALGVAGVPVVRPDSLVVDRGRVYLSQAFKDACERLGISIQLARPRRPTDKSHIESVFNAIREDFVQGLPGYKGADLHSRGAQSMVEDKAFYFIDEIESLFAEWVATYWQKRPHAGLDFPELPRLPLCPNDMYEQGLAKAGFPYIVPDSRMYFELLPTEWRVIDDRGVQVNNLLYDGDILEEFRNQKSGIWGGASWPLAHSR